MVCLVGYIIDGEQAALPDVLTFDPYNRRASTDANDSTAQSTRHTRAPQVETH